MAGSLEQDNSYNQTSDNEALKNWAEATAAGAFFTPESAMGNARIAGQLIIGAVKQVIEHPKETAKEAVEGAAITGVAIVGGVTLADTAVIGAGVGAVAGSIYVGNVWYHEGLSAVPAHLKEAYEQAKQTLTSTTHAMETVYESHTNDPKLADAKAMVQSAGAHGTPIAVTLLGGITGGGLASRVISATINLAGQLVLEASQAAESTLGSIRLRPAPEYVPAIANPGNKLMISHVVPELKPNINAVVTEGASSTEGGASGLPDAELSPIRLGRGRILRIPKLEIEGGSRYLHRLFTGATPPPVAIPPEKLTYALFVQQMKDQGMTPYDVIRNAVNPQNLLGSGKEAIAFEIPALPHFVLRAVTMRSIETFRSWQERIDSAIGNILPEKTEAAPVEDFDPSSNFGQAIARLNFGSNFRTMLIHKKVLGRTLFTPDSLEIGMRQYNPTKDEEAANPVLTAKSNRDLRAVAQLPMATYRDYVAQLQRITQLDLAFDLGSANLLLNNQRLQIIDAEEGPSWKNQNTIQAIIPQLTNGYYFSYITDPVAAAYYSQILRKAVRAGLEGGLSHEKLNEGNMMINYELFQEYQKLVAKYGQGR